MIVVCADYVVHPDAISVQLSHFQFLWAHVNFFILHFLAQLATLMPSQNYSMLSQIRAIRLIYYVYSVYLLLAIAEYNEASCRGKSAGQCQHLPNWAP